MILYWMILTHLLYDFHWQGDFVAQGKSKSWFIMFIHSLTWAMIVSVPIYIVNADKWTWAFMFLYLTHYLMDDFKSRKLLSMGIKALYIDQLFHLVTILAVWLWI